MAYKHDERLHVIRSDGTLWASGKNTDQYLGIGTAANVSTLTQIGVATNWAYVSYCTMHGMGIRGDGTLWGWGRNTEGQLGIGNYTTPQSSPAQVGTDTNWKTVACGYDYTLATKTDGTLWSWGNGNHYETGQGNTTNLNVPTQVGVATDWAYVIALDNSYGVKNNRALWGWGTDYSGGLLQGGGDAILSTPTQIDAGPWKQVYAGSDNMAGVKGDGTLWGWGSNEDNQLTAALGAAVLTPTQIGTDTDWAAAYPGGNYGTNEQFAVYRKTNGTIWSCGTSPYGQLGLGDLTAKTVLTQIGTRTDWSKVMAGGWQAYAIDSTGALYGWGSDWSGELAQGSVTDHQVSPVPIDAANTFTTLYDAPDFSPINISIVGIINSVAYISGANLKHVSDAGIVESAFSFETEIVARNVIAPMCFIEMTLLKVNGDPVGSATTSLGTVNGKTVIIDSWEGVKVTASVALRSFISGKVISTDKIEATTDANGYAVFAVFQGYTVTVNCSSLKTGVIVDTTGLNTLDISSYL